VLGWGVVAGVLGIALALGMRGWTAWRYRPYVYTLEEVPESRAAVVFGAAVWPGGRLSPMLEDRVETAVALYHLGKVEVLVLSGGDGAAGYNEPEHMRDFALARGVPPEDIVLDHAGNRTYDSCYRAVHTFGLSEAILVTQAYHLDRALFTARHLGLDAVGVPADRREYAFIRRYRLREVLATAGAWWDVFVARPRPALGEPGPVLVEA